MVQKDRIQGKINITPTNGETRRTKGRGSIRTSAKKQHTQRYTYGSKEESGDKIEARWLHGTWAIAGPKRLRYGSYISRHTIQIRTGQGKVRRREAKAKLGNTTQQGPKDGIKDDVTK